MMAFGCLLAVAALVHYRAVNRAIAGGEAGPSERLVTGGAIVIAVLGALMIAYMLSAARHL
jgi:uncharacterized membrane protein YidH (DUF202 family)